MAANAESTAKVAKKKAATKKTATKRAVTKKAAAKKTARKSPANKTPRAKAAPRKAATARKAGAAKKVSGGKAATKRRAARPTNVPLMNTLRAEHRHMATVMRLFREQLDTIAAGELIDPHVVYEVMEYMVTWPDRFHHPREDLIYARVAELDGKAQDEVDTLQRDHDHTARIGREILRDIGRWREGTVAGSVIIERGRDYIEHIHEHMNLEEELVFPHIESVLTLEDWRELSEDDHLQAVANPVFGPQVQREFRNMTRKLRRSVRRQVERGTMLEWIGIESFMESLEVVSIAYESARDSTGDHVRGAFRDSLDILRKDFFRAPLKIAGNNARVTFRIIGDVAEISRETFTDLGRVNQERKDRVRLLERNSPRD